MASDKRRESMATATAGHEEPRYPMLLVVHGRAHMVGEAGDRRVALDDLAHQPSEPVTRRGGGHGLVRSRVGAAG